MNIWRQTKNPLLLVFATSAMILAGCSPDLDVAPAIAPDLQVHVEFAGHHQDIDGHWSANIVSTSTEVPSNLQSLPGHAEKDLHHLNTVVPGQIVVFPTSENMRPGVWDISIIVTSEDIRLIDVDCRIEMPATLGGAQVISVKVIEKQSNCTSDTSGVSQPVTPDRDIALLPFTLPASVEQGQQISINVNAINYGQIDENFAIDFEDIPASGSPGVLLPTQHAITGLAPTGSATRTSQWNTAGASIGDHALRVSVPALVYETDTTNNVQLVTVNVTQPPEHDLEVSGLNVPAPVVVGGSYIVGVDMINNGEAEETFTVSLEDTAPGGGTTPIDTSSPLSLAQGATGNYNFTWDTTGAIPGTHTLTATIPLLASGESSDINNTRTATAVVESHDVESVSLGAPASADIGVLVIAVATVRNNGNINEDTVDVSLTAQPPGGGAPINIATQRVSVNAGATRQVNFSWDTACITPVGNYTLTSTALVANDSVPANDSVSTTPINLGIDHELSIAFINPPASVSQGVGTGIIVRVTNNNSSAETGIDVDFIDTPVIGPTGSVNRDPRLPIGIACGQSTDLIFTWFPPSTIAADHVLTTSIITNITGDNPADNTVSTTVTVVP